jgi:hypothetical protein
MSRLADGNGHRWFPIKKEELFIDQWKDIAKELEPYSDKVISSDAMEAEDPRIGLCRRSHPEHGGGARKHDKQSHCFILLQIGAIVSSLLNADDHH